MIIGTINKGYEQIHIKEDNGKISFIKVNDKVSTLNKVDALNVLKETFNTNNLKYLESNEGYDIYLDLANNKRYFKNGIEDFRMFYDNNGESSIVYSKKRHSNRQKVFSIVTTIGVITTLMLTSEGINNYIVKYINTNASDKNTIIETIDNNESSTIVTEVIDNSEVTDVISEEPFIDSYVDTAYEMETYINESNELTNAEKKLLSNTDYFNFILNNTDESSKLYDYNVRMKDINFKTFNDETNIAGDNANGYYVYGTNNIYIREDYMDNLRTFNDIATHEFIHLTQVSTNYRYIKEALAEILSREFYDTPINTYIQCVANTKMLIEIIGPEAVANAVFSHDTTEFEDAIKQYLDEEECNKFFELLNSSDIYEDELDEVLDNEITSYIKQMLSKKENYNQSQIELIEYATKPQHNNSKFYFNNNREEYYTEIQHTIYGESDYKPVDSIKNYLESNGTPNNIEIFAIELTQKQFLNNLSEIKQLYIDYNIPKNIIGSTFSNKVYNEYDDEYDEDSAVDDNIGYSLGEDEEYAFILSIDDKGNFLNDDKPISDEELIKEINKYDDLNFTLNLYLSYTWDEFTNNQVNFIYDKQYEADVHYMDGKTITVYNNCIYQTVLETVTLPSISERFNIEYLNKGKSK